MINGYSAQIVLPVIRDITPVLEDWIWEVTRDGRYRRSVAFTSDMTFIDEDFAFITVLGGLDPCATITVEISRYGIVVDTIDLKPASGDHTSHSVTLSPIAIDPLAVVKSNWETKFNMLSLPNKITVSPAPPIGVLSAEVICNGGGAGPTNSCLPNALGWTLTEWTITRDEDLTTGAITESNRSRYRREEFTGPTSPGPDWLNAGGNLWVRPLTIIGTRTFGSSDVDLGANTSTTEFTTQYLALGFTAGDIATADNGIALYDLLDNLTLDIGLTVRSEVLSINPTGTTATAGPYAHLADYANIILFQKTDITKVDATQNATKADITLKETLELLESWNLHWFMDGTVLRIEHPAFFAQVQGLNFDVRRNFHLDSYTYDDASDIKFLDYEWQDETDEAFDGSPIEYTCTGSKTEDVPAGRFTSNVTYMLTNPDEIDKSGFVPVATTMTSATTAEYIVDQGLNSINYLNSPLSWPVIAERFYQHDAPAPTGIINGNPVVFASTRPLRKCESLNLPIGDFFAYVPEELVLTPIGWAEVDSATYSGRAQTITVETIAP